MKFRTIIELADESELEIYESNNEIFLNCDGDTFILDAFSADKISRVLNEHVAIINERKWEEKHKITTLNSSCSPTPTINNIYVAKDVV